MLDLNPYQLLTTTRSVRKRLDLTRPVPMDVIRDCIEVALQAPSGGNSQGWHFVVVTDPAKKLAIANLYRQAWRQYAGIEAGDAQDVKAQTGPQRILNSADHLALHMQDVPVLLIPCIQDRPDGLPAWQQSSLFGSILPAAWSFMLAARLNGLASCWTTLHLMYEAEAAQVLGIPFDRVTQTALIPVAYPIGEDFNPASRKPLENVLHMNGW